MSIKPLSDKQRRCVAESTARLNFAWGAVRSGKSVGIEQVRWPEYVKDAPEGDLLMIGKTLKTLERNVLRPLQSEYGEALVNYSLGNKKANVLGREVDIEGGNDDAAFKKIQGMTCAGILFNELTLIPESMFNQALSRLSVRGAKMFATMNPEGPKHYVKDKYLNRASDLNLRHWKFYIDDNDYLDPEYVSSLKKEYTGVWYDRYIASKWVAAEGVVYDMFKEFEHVVSETPKCYRYWLSVDYGTATVTCFLLLGQARDGTIYVLDEFVWDAKKKGRQKTDPELADDLWEFQKGISHTGVLCDPSAVSFMLQCSQRKKSIRIIPANNEVLEGIRNVSSLFSNGYLKIHEKCTNLINELHSYCWDETKQNKGIDKPLKQDDHLNDCLRYAIRAKRKYWKKLLL